jgi:hypothetical protein
VAWGFLMLGGLFETAYAVWTGIGAVGTAMVGMMWLGDPAAFVRIASILLIVSGIVGLDLSHSNGYWALRAGGRQRPRADRSIRRRTTPVCRGSDRR